MTADERAEVDRSEREAAELDQEDAVHDALADLGVAVREFAEARRLYEHAIAAAGAAGARMKAAALNEERALEAVRALHGAPEVVDAEIVEDDPAIYCDPHEMPEETPDACSPEIGELNGGLWSWQCPVHHVGNYACSNEGAARRAAASHSVSGL